MDNNTGSFGAATGGLTPELKEAMDRRSNQGAASVPLTQQVTNDAPTMNPATQGPSMPSIGGSPAAGMTSPQPLPTVSNPQDTSLIIKALSNKLASDSKLAEKANGG